MRRTASTGLIARGIGYVQIPDIETCRKFAEGRFTAQDVVDLVLRENNGRAGVWWGSIGDNEWDYYDDEYAPFHHAYYSSNSDPMTIVAEYDEAAEEYGDQVVYSEKADIGVVLYAEHPYVNGTYWNPLTDNQPIPGHQSQSYVPEGTQLRLVKVGVEHAGLVDEIYLPANGMTVTAALGGQGITVTADRYFTEGPIELLSGPRNVTASDLDDILDLLGPWPTREVEEWSPPENTHPGIDGVPRGWELYVEDMLAAPDRNASADLWMPTSAVAHYAEYARDGEQLDAVMYAIQKRGGIWSPVDISTDGRLALLHEGNHRLAAAQRLGIAEIPVRVSVDPVVRANEGTPVPLEPVLEGWLRQTGRIAATRTAAEPGGVLPYPPSDFGYRWDRLDPETYAAVTRDGISEMTLWFGAPGGQVQWTVEDDLGIVERGYISGADPDQIFDRANRLISEFDTNPAIPSKSDGYDGSYTETFPTHDPAPDFREPGVYR